MWTELLPTHPFSQFQERMNLTAKRAGFLLNSGSYDVSCHLLFRSPPALASLSHIVGSHARARIDVMPTLALMSRPRSRWCHARACPGIRKLFLGAIQWLRSYCGLLVFQYWLRIEQVFGGYRALYTFLTFIYQRADIGSCQCSTQKSILPLSSGPQPYLHTYWYRMTGHWENSCVWTLKGVLNLKLNLQIRWFYTEVIFVLI